MKIHGRRFMLWFVVLLLLALATYPVGAKTVKTFFTGTEQYIGDIDPGVEWITKGGTYHLRDNTGLSHISTSDPRVQGDNYIVLNGNFTFLPEPVFVTGHMWGTFRLISEGGTWTGTYNGFRDENGFSFFKYVGHGSEGYEGLQLRMEYERLDPDPMAEGTITGYILEKAP